MRSLTDDEDFVTIKGPWLANVSVATWGDNSKNVFFLWSPGRVHIINKINEENDGKRKKNIIEDEVSKETKLLWFFLLET